MTKYEIISRLKDDDLFLLAYEFFNPHEGMSREQIILSVGIERLFKVYKTAVEYVYNEMIKEEKDGKIMLSGKMVDIDDLDDVVLDERMDIMQHYYEELVRCVDAEKKR
jgi:hypothetical protein